MFGAKHLFLLGWVLIKVEVHPMLPRGGASPHLRGGQPRAFCYALAPGNWNPRGIGTCLHC